MPEFRAVVHVMLRRAVLDPQGRAVAATLARLGHQNVGEVRVGKRIELTLEGSRSEVEGQLASMSTSVLSNPVIEDVEVELHEIAPGRA